MQKKQTRLTMLATIILAVSMIMLPASQVAAQQPVSVRLASFNVGGSWYIWATAISSVARPALPAGSTLDVLPYQGGIGNPLLLEKGKADIALSFLPCSKWAYEGLPPYENANENLRALAGGLSRPHRVGVLIRKGSKITSLSDVVNKKLPAKIVTAQRGATGQAVALQLLTEYGITVEKLKKWGGSLEHLRMPVAIGRIKDGHADIIIHNVGYKEPRFSELCLTTGIIFDEVDQAIQKRMAENYGYVYGLSIEKDEFKGVTKDVPAIGYPTGLITTADLADDVAYAITKAVCENPKALAEAHASLKVFSPEKAWQPEVNGIPLHPGAIKYYKEKGWMK